jgi:hypothetical protein
MLGLLAILVDFELFSFLGKRLSFDFFFMADDILDQIPQLLYHYWYIPFLSVAVTMYLYFLDKKFFIVQDSRLSWFSFFSGFLFLVIFAIGIRGGLQHKSINVQSAFIQGNNDLGHLVLNTPYHFFRTLRFRPHKKIN